MKIVGVVVLVLTLLLGGWNWGDLSLWSLALGVAIGAGCFALFPAPKTPLQPPVDEWKTKFHILEAETAQTVDRLKGEVQKLQQKMVRTEERCQSYQKLVDVHQNEIEKLVQEKKDLSGSLVDKERKLGAAQLAQLEPDLFDMNRRQTEVALRELRKQFEEKSELLAQARSEINALTKMKKKRPILSESRDLLE